MTVHARITGEIFVHVIQKREKQLAGKINTDLIGSMTPSSLPTLTSTSCSPMRSTSRPSGAVRSTRHWARSLAGRQPHVTCSSCGCPCMTCRTLYLVRGRVQGPQAALLTGMTETTCPCSHTSTVKAQRLARLHLTRMARNTQCTSFYPMSATGSPIWWTRPPQGWSTYLYSIIHIYPRRQPPPPNSR